MIKYSPPTENDKQNSDVTADTDTHTALQLQNTFIIQLFGESFMSSAHLQLV